MKQNKAKKYKQKTQQKERNKETKEHCGIYIKQLFSMCGKLFYYLS